jgi:hypothetical protein
MTQKRSHTPPKAKMIRPLIKRLLHIPPRISFLIVVTLIFCTSVSALLIQSSYKAKPLSPQTTSTPTKQITSPAAVQQTQSKPSISTSNETIPANNASTSNTRMPDGDGCTPGLDSYQACRDAVAKIQFMSQCDTDMKAANDALDAVYNPARASYDADIATQQQEVNNAITQYGYTSGWGAGVMVDYTHQRAQQYNAVIAPAYSTYVTAFDAINARGCNLIKTYSNPSLPF